MNVNSQRVDALRQYFAGQPDVLLAFLFGSAATGRETAESDVDVAVYLREPAREDAIWRGVAACVRAEVDLVRLDTAPASLVSGVLKHGIALLVRDRALFWRLLLNQGLEAEDFAEFARSYHTIAARSASLSPEDAVRLAERLQFLDNEIKELQAMRAINLEVYRSDKTQRRNVERWAENLLNAAIDISKILLASSHQPMPRTYQDALETIARAAGLDESQAQRFSGFARLRNLLAHDYLEILYDRLVDFIREFPPLLARVRTYAGERLQIR